MVHAFWISSPAKCKKWYLGRRNEDVTSPYSGFDAHYSSQTAPSGGVRTRRDRTAHCQCDAAVYKNRAERCTDTTEREEGRRVSRYNLVARGWARVVDFRDSVSHCT